MTTEKQLIANQHNAQLSTGPLSAIGKAMVAKNAIKHGIFTKDLIFSSDAECENVTDYQELLSNLINSLEPCNQIESLLVEKIAVDFWRLRRTIRYEKGSLIHNINKIFNDHYSYRNPNNEKLDDQISYKQGCIAWNELYLESLRKGRVCFEQPEWNGDEIKSDITEDFYMIAKSIPSLTKSERDMLYNSGLDFKTLKALLVKYGLSTAENISARLIELIAAENASLDKEIQKQSKQKKANEASDNLMRMLGMTPTTENADKILKYERSLQKSIFQNIMMLKKLQGVF